MRYKVAVDVSIYGNPSSSETRGEVWGFSSLDLCVPFVVGLCLLTTPLYGSWQQNAILKFVSLYAVILCETRVNLNKSVDPLEEKKKCRGVVLY